MTKTIEKNIDEDKKPRISEKEKQNVLNRSKSWSKLKNRYILAWHNIDYIKFSRKFLVMFIISFISTLISPAFIAAVPSLIILYSMFEAEFGNISLFEISNLSVFAGIMYFISLLSYSTSGSFLLISLCVSLMTIIYSLVYSYIVETSGSGLKQNLSS